MLRDYLFTLWVRACSDDETQSHRGFVDGSLSIHDREGNIVKISPRTATEPAYIAGIKCVNRNVPFGGLEIPEVKFAALKDIWTEAWEEDRFKKWNNEKITA